MTADPLSPLLTQGVLGVVCVLLLLLGRTFFSISEKAHTRELKAKDEAHARELATKDEAHLREVTAIRESHQREVAAKDAQIVALMADKAALDATVGEQAKFIRDALVPGLTRITDISHEYIDVLSAQSRRAIGSGP